MNYVHRGFFWITVYLFLVLAPLFVLLFAPGSSGNGFRHDFSIALGFAGTSMMATMFVITARFRRATLPFGVDIIYYFHRWIALVGLLFIAAHPAILIMLEPEIIAELHPSIISRNMAAGVSSVVLLAALVITSLWRQQLQIHYDEWRIYHILLATGALGLAIYHIEAIGNYVSSPWKRAVWAIILISCLVVLLYVRMIKPMLSLRRPYVVEEVVRERGNAWTLVLRPQGHDGLLFMPGQFAWLTLGNSPFALKEHPFSISSSAARHGKIHFTIKELGDFTRQIKNVSSGQAAYLDGPHGCFTIDRHPDADYVFIGGGIGMAPIMGMLRTLADRHDNRELLLIYAYNTWEELTFREELERLQKCLRLRIVHVLATPPELWQGEAGVITEEMLVRHLPERAGRFHYYLCGPVVMTVKVERMLRRQGVKLNHIHTELFELV